MSAKVITSFGSTRCQMKAVIASVVSLLMLAGSLLGQSTPLVDAAAKADIVRVRSLLARGANPNEVDNSEIKGWTPLMAAAKAGSIDVAKALIDAHADVNAVNEYGGTALDIAITSGKTALALFIEAAGGEGREHQKLTAIPPDVSESNLDALLLEAVKTGDGAAVQQLLQQGANADARGPSGVTPLMIASVNGHTDVVKLLLVAKASVDAISRDGLTPLYGASQNDGHPDVVKVLLAAGANTEAAASNGATPLEVASGDGATEVVKLLLAAGAKVDAATHQGYTPLIDASKHGHAGVVKLLLGAHADVNAALEDTSNSLMLASQGGYADVVKLLLAAGAKVDAVASNGATSLFLAAGGGHAAVVSLLLAAHANLNFSGPNGWTPLWIASGDGYAEVVKLLLAAGANPKAAADNGITAIMIASQRGHPDIVHLLRSGGTGAKSGLGSGQTTPSQKAPANQKQAAGLGSVEQKFLCTRAGFQEDHYFVNVVAKRVRTDSEVIGGPNGRDAWAMKDVSITADAISFTQMIDYGGVVLVRKVGINRKDGSFTNNGKAEGKCVVVDKF